MRFFITSLLVLCIVSFGYAQKATKPQHQNVVYPNTIKTPIGFSISAPLRDAPIAQESKDTGEEFYMNKQRDRVLNPNIFPPDFKNMPPDPGEQTFMGTTQAGRGLEQNFAGQNSGSYPPDCNGTVGPNHYFQVVNTTYQIFNKSDGSSAAGPSNLNTIFDSGLPGAGDNDGDPIVLWDEQADRWFYAEFSVPSLSGAGNDHMLIAVSTTNDPTGSWYSWSFDVSDAPDYMKFGIWQDGYYMSTNTSPGNDVYVFERDVMIAGGASPTMIAFDNPDRPDTFDGFHCLLPLDNDGPWAPSGTSGQFITIADDDQSNADDELRIYELDADWTTPANSTFSMVQQIPVNSFAGNFTGNWNNIPQPGTTQKLDAISTVLMYRAQYRNFGGTEKIVCVHAIAETSTQAVLRWYELENTGSGWAIAQQSTYNPDALSRWNASIAMNDAGQIAMGYSVSDGSSTYPGIRYCGQNAGAATGMMDIAETTIWTGAYSQTLANRWGDYCNISVDPSDGLTFWYTNEYKSSSSHGTRIAEITLPAACTAPSTQASNYTLVGATSNSLNISWTRGNGDAVIILAREASQVNSNPISGNTYSASSVFGFGNEIGTGNFVVYNGTGTNATITGLTAGTAYYFSLYEYLNADDCYLTPAHSGSSTTLGPPSLETNQVTNIVGPTASGGGEVFSDNGAAVTARGVCWNTTGSPTTTDPKTNDGSGTGIFTSTLTGLSPATVYYVRAYATNSYGTSYGNEVLFTEDPPCTTYCSASGGGDEYISGVQMGSINNTGTAEGDYEDFTALSTNVTVNQSYDIIITNGHSYSVDDLGIWVDWNQDCDFDDADENVVCAINDGAEGTYSITVPDTALIGTTTMRIRMKYSGSDCGSPCGTTTWGEVEDYTLNVQPGSSMWNGTTTNWDDPTNWPDGIIPHASYEVVIPTTPVNGEFPVIPMGTNAKCYSLTLQNGATITINGTLEEMK